jgi:DNA-binding SARP family transcriptional activator/tetratricopeptide (TPR) repeat protein
MRFDILGPLRIGQGAGEPAVTAGRDRVVLGMLLLHPGRIVGTEELIDAVWEGAPPATARGQLQTCVSRLRRALPVDAIITDPAGYGIRVGEDDIDAVVFARLTALARRHAAESPDEARRLFRAALDLWRGPALAGIDSRTVRQGAAVLDEQHAVAIEDWVDLELSGGRERDLIGELTGLVESFPLRERLRAQLMLALYRAGRQADALAEYRRARQVLQDELGIDPGPDLRDLHQRILTGEVASAASHVRAPVAPVRCLPRTVGDFTGRAAIVDRLVRAIEQADAGGPLIHLIDGMAGSGKTTLALHVANTVGDRYPDAQIFVDLHGHSRREPVEPATALVTLLRQLGVDAERIPADLDERVALWRSQLAARRVLVVLDNAGGTAQVTPLLPAAPGSLALVTSRRRLTGLDGVRPESLQVLTETEAVALLGRIVGARVAAEPDAAAEVVRRCGRLPLAVRLAGARLAHRPRWRVADLVRRLGESTLPELAAEDRTVASAFALSYGQLDQPAQRIFRLLGLHPGEGFDALAVAALADLPLDDAQDILDALVDVHLVEEPEPGHYRLHDLMREYAANLAATDDAGESAAAIRRLIDHKVHAIATFTRPMETGAACLEFPTPQAARPDLVEAIDDGTRWLEANRRGLTAIIDAAVRTGDHVSAWQLPRVSWRFLFLHGYYDDVIETQLRGLAAARAAADDAGTAACLNYLASAYFRTGRVTEVLSILPQAIDIRLRMGDERAVAVLRSNLVGVLVSAGRLREAMDQVLLTMAVWRRLDEKGMLRALADAGQITAELGDFDGALRYHRRDLLLAAEHGDGFAKAVAFGHLGQVRLRQGKLRPALRLLRLALRLKRTHAYGFGEVEGLNDLALALRMDGRTAEAIALHLEALRLARQRRERRQEAITCNDYAATMRAAGDREAALDLHRQALRTARQFEVAKEQARALEGMAACLVREDSQAARRYWEQALVLFRRMGVPARFEVERRLAELDRGVDQLQEAGDRGTMET